jgi:hypothetical protein
MDANGWPGAGVPEAAQSSSREGGNEVLSSRVQTLLDDVLAGRAPNAGRFCGYCYHLLSQEGDKCSWCARSTAESRPVDAVPHAVLEAHRLRRAREGLVVRTIAWTGLTMGVVVALVPLAFAGVTWWSVASFFVLLFAFYILSANLANSLGDVLGYRWGTSLFRRKWEEFIRERDGLRQSAEPTGPDENVNLPG